MTRMAREAEDPNALASDPAMLTLCRIIARKQAGSFASSPERHEQRFEEYESAAFLGLVEAAKTFDPRVGASFKTHAFSRIVGAIQDYRRQVGLKGYRRSSAEDLPRVKSLNISDHDFHEDDRPTYLKNELASDEMPVGWELEYEDEIRAMSRRMPRRCAVALRMIYLDAAHCRFKDVALVMGLGEPRISQLHSEAIGFLVARESARRGPGEPRDPGEANPASGTMGVTTETTRTPKRKPGRPTVFQSRLMRRNRDQAAMDLPTNG